MKISEKFNLSYISLAVLGALAATSTFADTTAETLDEIVVSDRQGAKVQTNVVTLEEQDESTATDLRSLLAEEPAIDFGGGNGTSQFLTIRGMGQNSVDIKVDNAYSDSQILYHQGRFIIDPSLLKSVSVQKGAGSASAGIGATNGAIIAKTVDALDLLKNSDRDYGFKLNSGYSSNEGHSYGGALFGKAGNFDALFSFNRTDEDDYKPGKGYANQYGGKTVLKSGLDKRNYLIKLGATFGDHRLVLSHLQDQHRGERFVREEFGWATTLRNGRISSNSPSYRETTQRNTNLEWTAKNLGFISELTANAYLMQNKRYSADDSGCGYCGNIAGPTTTKIETRGANINFDSPIGDSVLLKYGVNYRDQKIVPHTFFTSMTVNRQQVALPPLSSPKKADIGTYLEAIGAVGDFTLTAGMRYDYFKVKTMDGKEVSDGRVNPSVGVIYQPLDSLSFSFDHNYASRSPRLYDALTTHGKRGVVSIADGTVAERARNTEIGFNFDYNGLTLAGSYFWQKINDAIANPQNRHDSALIKETTNAGYIKNHGYELSAAYKLNGFMARIGVAESKPRIYDTHPGNLLSSNPEFAVQTGRTWTAELAYRFAKPNLELGWRNRTVEDAEGSVLVRDVGEVKREGYTVHDFYINWKPFNDDNLNINASLNNAFNKLYYPHSQRGETLAGVGRDFRVGINYQF
ncbi:hemoglobin/transferrin/lactoferrin receptor protein [Pasteurella testudinis DSM 23072]|uniref:Hemoglobin/transferrin/lactoferrin receptor protein n=1 Tax=Pasteurella testudinis DSM 23072 TaxID=1122938 RepID=A0A1W1UWI4_9PAST|nr:TonB-dependent siderophore receptor [Pasteurella testudinis]SMB85054.1 hemoglobin/transferrin/lactoferrin receptor protein [Pasteurella testudinis DSM 23072]SUB52914.1 TonB-dependent heme receptor A [Pasteurella testudinis]